MAISSNADVIRHLFNEINKASDRAYAAHRFQNEMMERLEYYIMQWSDCQAGQANGWEQQADKLRVYIDSQIELIKDYRIALFRATKLANQQKQQAKYNKDPKLAKPGKTGTAGQKALKLVSDMAEDMTVLPDKADDTGD